MPDTLPSEFEVVLAIAGLWCGDALDDLGIAVPDATISELVKAFKPIPFKDENGVEIGTVVSAREEEGKLIGWVVLKEKGDGHRKRKRKGGSAARRSASRQSRAVGLAMVRFGDGAPIPVSRWRIEPQPVEAPLEASLVTLPATNDASIAWTAPERSPEDPRLVALLDSLDAIPVIEFWTWRKRAGIVADWLEEHADARHQLLRDELAKPARGAFGLFPFNYDQGRLRVAPDDWRARVQEVAALLRHGILSRSRLPARSGFSFGGFLNAVRHNADADRHLNLLFGNPDAPLPSGVIEGHSLLQAEANP